VSVFDIKTKEVVVRKTRVDVKRRYILDSLGCLTRHCMIKQGASAALLRDGVAGLSKLEVDGGHLRAIFDGYHWTADMPKNGFNMLKLYDRIWKIKNKQKREEQLNLLPEFVMTVEWRRGTKVRPPTPVTPKRLAQIKKARAAREARRGTRDRDVYKTTRSRLVGYVA
jgi:hypothetical protein